ncbi:discoidin domain-containing protein [Pedobacter nyackensis]|uniref:F5/8 type C domain-containing protein n=1 Tax=Pedobacter nyackensis TaxID=475255 RepID=A0A1W2A9W6_9SPHI|nr:discoidin domain-containing protein [Pedobacter nyackensis]SMC57456.1 F5/8 type C domain-containing protein [Pedobacter nyackensis]
MKKTSLLLCLPLFFAACTKNVPVEIVEATPPVVVDTGFTSDHTYNLNVVYFVPTDNPAKAEYERRLSDIMLSAQTYYGNQMQANGYGFKTFGLLTNPSKTRIKIITIPAKYTCDKYTDANLAGILAEVEDYFTAHPGEKTGDHNLIISPSQPSGIGNPYVGYGRSCFWPDRGEEVTSTTGIGGLMHELGHGINLPHNRQRESRINDPNYGTSLMGSGNGTYGKSPTFLTEADCAILNTNQVFQKNTSITYYGAVTAKIKRMYASYSVAKGVIIASGRFTSSVPVTDVTYYLDPNHNNEGVGVNKDYNAVTWSTKVIGTDSFYVELPMTEMSDTYKANNPAELKVKLVHENGKITNTTFNFNFLNNIPVINIAPSGFDKSEWTVIDFSSQETVAENKPASYMIDDDKNTFWFAKYSSPAAVLPHYVTIDISHSVTADGFTILLRSGAYRAVKDVEILTSSDNLTWTSAGNFVVPKVDTESKIPFGSSKTFRYFKIIVKSNYDTVEPNKSCIVELGLYKN